MRKVALSKHPLQAVDSGLPIARELWSFRDLQARGIVGSRSMLSVMIKQRGFPKPIYLGPRSARYDADAVRAWLRSVQSDPVVPDRLAGINRKAA